MECARARRENRRPCCHECRWRPDIWRAGSRERGSGHCTSGWRNAATGCLLGLRHRCSVDLAERCRDDDPHCAFRRRPHVRPVSRAAASRSARGSRLAGRGRGRNRRRSCHLAGSSRPCGRGQRQARTRRGAEHGGEARRRGNGAEVGLVLLRRRRRAADRHRRVLLLQDCGRLCARGNGVRGVAPRVRREHS
jgi:hypothetical protein